jgi:hypothetical protein
LEEFVTVVACEAGSLMGSTWVWEIYISSEFKQQASKTFAKFSTFGSTLSLVVGGIGDGLLDHAKSKLVVQLVIVAIG